MEIVIFLVIGCLFGFVLFKKNAIFINDGGCEKSSKLSVIIPARNEEKNLPVILSSLIKQTYQPFEIIVVDDGSVDQTQAVSESYGAKVIQNPALPLGWTGKTWAVWNGYLASSGELIAFLDTDIKLSPHALESLLIERKNKSGVLSVCPFHETKEFFERFALITNILGVFSFTSPFEKKNRKQGLYGSCILATREDYEKVNGHSSIKGEILDDLNLGAKFIEAGIPVNNYIGDQMVSFRMYPQGIKSELQGFAKGAILSPSHLSLPTTVFIIIWILGLILSSAFILFLNTTWFVPLFIGYILYTVQILYFVKVVGYFGKLMPILHIL